MNKKPVVLVVAGHGGLNALGEYPRKDKRSPEVPPGIFEGEWNRTTAQVITDHLTAAGITAQFVNPGPLSAPLKSLLGYIQDTAKRATPRPLVVLEVHANSEVVEHYDPRGWGSARGVVAFHPKNGSEPSRLLASTLIEKLQEEGYRIPSRGVKSAAFTMIMKCPGPAVLLECGFMSSREDVALLQDPQEVEKIARAVVSTVAALYQ